MTDLKIAIGQITLRIRHAQTLKDKRRVVQSLVTKMRNLGASVTECGHQESPKMAAIGFAFAAGDTGQANDAMTKIERLLLGEFEVAEFHRELVDYADPREPLFSESILDDRDPMED